MRFSFAVLLLGLLAAPPVRADFVPGSLEVRWNVGSDDCKRRPPPPLQVHRYAEGTYILRESLCTTFEAPFMYLLIGSARALLIDTGDVADASVAPLARTVLDLLPDDGGTRRRLLVVHTHGHLDHHAGDVQFAGMAGVDVVGADLAHVQQYFHFEHWPDRGAAIDLGDRVVDALPTPGHHPSHVAYYDRATGLLFSGDFLLPGRLLIDDADADLASARRMADFAATHPISHVLGGHIEWDAAGSTYAPGSGPRLNEHALALDRSELLALPAVIAGYNGFYSRNGMYIVMSQTRVLLLLVVSAIAGLAFIGWGIVRVVRAYRRRRALRT